ncbi:hypothetical protein HZH68_000369 [Vespula germanica]|uniref:Uncharacterized protein n=1 Tax=Vespula germanica TaxID=30212 RepID=A0A834NTH3_VESGE|nr:hypothetical protein HZH68_000369 [Vespula germanica]
MNVELNFSAIMQCKDGVYHTASAEEGGNESGGGSDSSGGGGGNDDGSSISIRISHIDAYASVRSSNSCVTRSCRRIARRTFDISTLRRDANVDAVGSSAARVSERQQLINTPSRRCGIDADKELSYRQQAANFIQDMGQRLVVYPLYQI